MEDPKLLRKKPRPVVRAAIWGASVFGFLTLGVIGADQLRIFTDLGLLFLIGSPAGCVEALTGFCPKGLLSGALFEAVASALLGALVFASLRSIWLILVKAGYKEQK